ncbi:Presequence protease, mitochondrial [Hondaea fermentalgiana]|uniref:Presequence protease, mitochondrial n=1 Tax=Hondaea fermentalgiana TaxID=2315210 RepID=A0A2R5GSB2_9STRA|nr:Presequence protease, mitochondrial [Hondaea fermentalgiana]|eukprot:GBG31533.1 Presequence protease, mitochondrial [Hondaea fermentalgiana]
MARNLRLSAVTSAGAMAARRGMSTAAAQRGAARAAAPAWLQVGGKMHGFEVKEVCPVPEFDVVAYHLEHERTAARHLHVACDDTNNVFSVAFRTPAQDSTGLPHILEHTVLCGSERFPVRDPFFNMIKRSLNTFMNAMTASDHTMYPFATLNEKDYANLMDVYLDATLFPRLDKMDFLQEGHRLERDPEDPSRIVRTGIVYNEMKGTLGDAATLYHYRLQQATLPGTTYANISGGEPTSIARLTHQDLVDFHRVHYHPSNAIFFTYGDLPLEPHLVRINESALSRFNFSQDAFDVRQALATSRIDHAKVESEVIVTGPAEVMTPLDRQAKVAISRPLEQDRHDEEYQNLVGRVLSSLLLDGASAPLYAALVDSQLAPDYAPGTGYDGSTMHPFVSIGVQGVSDKPEDLARIRSTIEESLVRVAREGFDPRRVEAIQHQTELAMKQPRTNFGLMVMYAVSNAFAHAPFAEGDLMRAINESMTVDAKMERLQSELDANPNFWQDAVTRFFLQPKADGSGDLELRDDITTFIMKPDESYTQKLEEQEREALAEIAKGLSAGEWEKMDSVAAELQEIQAAEQDVSCLPTLSVDDIPRIPQEMISVDASTPRGRNLTWVEDQKTNGVVYFRTLFDTSDVPADLKPLLPLLGTLIGNVDTASHSYQELSVDLNLACGGVGVASPVLSWYGQGAEATALEPSNHRLLDSARGLTRYRECVSVSSRALARNLDRTIDLVGDMLTTSDFGGNLHHVESILATSLNAATSGLSNDALGYARRWSLASLGGEHAKREALAGLSQVSLLQRCVADPRGTVDRLQALLRAVFREEAMTMNVVAGGTEIDESAVRASLDGLWGRLQDHNGAAVDADLTQGGPAAGMLASIEARTAMDATYIPLSISVHNCTAALPTEVCWGHPDDAAMMVLAQVASSNFLHQRIREQGGAYGGGAAHDLGGLFMMHSYYDPNAEDTLRVFAEALQWMCDGAKFSERDVEEAILSVFGSLDAPQSVSTKGTGPFVHGVSPEARLENRARFFELSKSKLVDVANRHLGKFAGNTDLFLAGPESGGHPGCVAVAGNKSTLFAENLQGWSTYKFD